MDDLIAFLRARLDEDQLNADAGFSHSDRWVMVGTGIPNGISCTAVLADVAAKRQIIDEHYDPDNEDENGNAFASHCRTCRAPGWGDEVAPFPCRTLRLLALPYADHPDYRPEWSPVDG